VNPPLPFLPYGRQMVTEEDIAAVTAVLRGDWLTQGPLVATFEEAVATRLGARHAVACATGTAALHLAYLALGLKPGDAVVVPSITFLATASTARACGAEVVFADVDPDTGLTSAARVEEAMARARAAGLTVRAVAPVHLAGQTADADAIAEAAEAAAGAPVPLVEDACHAIGTAVTGRDGVERMVGADRAGRLAAFSFHPVKTIATGEGGLVTTGDDTLAARLRRFRNHGMVHDPALFECPETGRDHEGTLGPWYYEMPEPGPNYRLTDIQCALGLSQFRRVDALAARRRVLADRYCERLAPLAPLVRPLARVPGCVPAWHLFVALIDFKAAGIGRTRVMKALRERGIGSQVHYIPVHRQPYWQRRHGLTPLPGADRYYARALSLPLFPAMADTDVDRVVDALADVLGIT
jgi:UDP-4-amino-4,6-dideoxy-N-acetyl-beta-L-altrosamine transaminase